MKRSILISALITLVVLPVVVITQAPAYVEGLDISLDEGEITLKWKEQPNMNIASYRIYYSFESILENDGLYDDVIETGSGENEHKFPPPEGYDEIYFAVIGVNKAGEDIDKFVEEISLQIDGGSGMPDDEEEDENDDESFLEDEEEDEDDDDLPFGDDDDDEDLPGIDESFLGDDDDLADDDDDDLFLDEDDDFADDDDDFDEGDLPFGDDDDEFADEDDDFADDDDHDLADDDFADEDLGGGDFEDDLMGGDEELLAIEDLGGSNDVLEAEIDDDVLMVQDETLSIPSKNKSVQNEMIDIPAVMTQEPELPARPLLPPPPPLPTSVSLLSAEAIAPNQVQLLFSAAILVEPTRASEAFSIVDSSGNPLHILQIAIQDKQATVNTQEQVAGTVYEFRISEPAYSPEGIPLDQIARRAFFNGHMNARGQTQVAGVDTQGPFQGVANLKLEQMPDGNGTFNVKVSWDVIGDQSELANYIVSQSRDGGMTFGDPQSLQANISGIEIPYVDPGPFGLLLSYVKKDGQAYMGKFQSINVGGVGISSMPTMAPVAQPIVKQTVPPVTASVKPLDHQPNALNNTGPGTFAAAVVVFGGVAGWMASRKRKLAIQ